MRVSDNRYESDLRKHNLARWMIAHDARTQTISRWTGLSRYRVQSLARRYSNREPDDRTRWGIAPTRLSFYMKSMDLEAHSLALAFILFEFKVIPVEVVPDARRSLPDLARGERLMLAYEWYRLLMPTAPIPFERALLLVIELAERRHMGIRRCRTCPDVMFVDLLGPPQHRCPFCRAERRPGDRALAATVPARDA